MWVMPQSKEMNASSLGYRANVNMITPECVVALVSKWGLSQICMKGV